MASKPTSRSMPNRVEDKSYNELEQKYKELQDKLDLLLKQNENDDGKFRDRGLDERMDIRSDAKIKVISLCANTLCLTGKRKDRPFIFRKFGDVKRIRYEELSDIIENHRTFLEDGEFMILDSEVIKFHDLEGAYDKIIDKETIEKVLSGNFSDAIKIVENANDRQKKTIAAMLVRKIINNEEVSLDFVDKVSRLVGFDINEKAQNSVEILKAYREPEDKEK